MGELPRTLRVEEFPSGAVYGYVLPNLERQMKAGMFPGVTKEIARKAMSGTLVDVDKDGRPVKEDQTDEELEQWTEFTARLVARMIRTEGGSITYDDPERSEARRMVMGHAIEPDSVEVGEPVTYTWEQLLDADEFPTDDLEELLTRGLRSKPAPKAVATAPFGKKKD